MAVVADEEGGGVHGAEYLLRDGLADYQRVMYAFATGGPYV